MNLISKEDRFFIERKYHDPEKPFNAYRRMQYHGWEYDPESGKTDEEISLVCKTQDAPPGASAREDGWRGFRVRGVLDFSLIGVLSKLSGVLAAHGIGLFAVSTYNTDYILVKEENWERALSALISEGYTVV